jgi:hypothetical protein
MADAIEREAESLYRSAGLDVVAGAAPGTLIRSLLGPESLRFVKERWLRGGGTLARVSSEWRVYLRFGMPPERARFVALHELAHWAMPGASEDDCDALAACLLAPRPAFERALAATARPRRSVLRVYSDLGAWFLCTDSFAALRHSEVTGAPLLLLSPARARARGVAYPWPAETLLRRLDVPGLRKARLRDDPRRVVVRA